MKKSILSIGTALKKAELMQINGGYDFNCGPAYSQSNCNEYCWSAVQIGALSILEDKCGVTVVS